MGKCWMVELENDMDHDELDFEIDSLIDVYHVKINDYPSNPLLAVMAKLESIICLAAEGPEVDHPGKLFQAILQEALEAMKIVEGENG